MEDSEIERALIAAQAAVTADEARKHRRNVVMQAVAAGWSKYRIAATLGVKGPTVTAIIASAERENAG